MWPPFFFGVIPTYGVLPYAMIYIGARISLDDCTSKMFTFYSKWAKSGDLTN